MKSRSGFTLIEVMVTIVVIAILATITIIAYTQVQTSTRNSARNGNVTIIAESLEKYYAKNGEYPSVRSIVNNYPDNTGTTVAAKLSINVSVLMMPKMPNGATNALTSSNPPSNDYIVYSGNSDNNNTSCQTVLAGGCDQFTLNYIAEGSGSLVALESRHKGSPNGTPGSVNKPTLAAALSGTNIIATASADTCNPGNLTAKFSFRYRANSGAWSTYNSWLTANTFSIAGIQGTTYDFQAVTRCDNGVIAGETSPESDIVSSTYPIDMPGNPTVSVTLSGSNALATTAVVSCSTGATAQYAIRSHVNEGAWSSYSAWSTTRTASQAATQGSIYGYQAKVRCQLGSMFSNEVFSTEASYTRPITTPSAPTVTTSTTGTVTTWSWPATSCPAGTTAEYQDQGTTDWNYDSGWTGPYANYTSTAWVTATNQGYQYAHAIQTRCKTAYINSNWSASGQASYISPITPPGVPTNFVATLTADRKRLDWTWTAPTCASGIQAQDQRAGWYSVTGAYGSWTAVGWYVAAWNQGLTSGGQPIVITAGKQFKIKAQYVCVNATTGRQSSFSAVTESPLYTAP